MTFFKKLKLLKHSFPKSWVRKLPLLLFPADVIVKDGVAAAMCTTFNKRIILICTHEKFRGQGLASTLIKRSGAVKTDTYVGNDAALKMWKKNGFDVEKVVDTPFGKKYIFRKKGQ